MANTDDMTVSVLSGNGDGTFRGHADLTLGWGPTSVLVADFNGDKAADLAVPNAVSNSVSILLNTKEH